EPRERRSLPPGPASPPIPDIAAPSHPANGHGSKCVTDTPVQSHRPRATTVHPAYGSFPAVDGSASSAPAASPGSAPETTTPADCVAPVERLLPSVADQAMLPPALRPASALRRSPSGNANRAPAAINSHDDPCPQTAATRFAA